MGFGFGWYDGYSYPPYYPYRDYDTFGSLRVIVEPEKEKARLQAAGGDVFPDQFRQAWFVDRDAAVL